MTPTTIELRQEIFFANYKEKFALQKYYILTR